MITYEILVEEVNSKNDLAWKELYKYYYAALCNFSFKITCDKVSTEDIVQDIFLKLWDSNLVFSDIAALTSYMYRSVYTRSLNFIRDRKNLEQIDSKVEGSVPNNDNDFILKAITEEAITQFYISLKELSVQQREIIILTLQGEKVKEISEMLEISINSVKTQKKRAYYQLRTLMGKNFPVGISLLFI